MQLAERLVRKLRMSAPIGAEDARAIAGLPVVAKEVPARKAVVREGEQPAHCGVLIDGFICRSKTTDAGKRQILAIHIAGDIPDLQSLHLPVMDHDVSTLSRCTIGFVPHEALRKLTRQHPLIAEALWRDTLIDAAVFREWIVNVGRRSALSRLAHLLAEIGSRLHAMELSAGDQFELPMTQQDIADALGLTPVHVNRIIQELRRDGLLTLHKHTISLPDLQRLKKVADFDDLYLHQREVLQERPAVDQAAIG